MAVSDGINRLKRSQPDLGQWDKVDTFTRNGGEQSRRMKPQGFRPFRIGSISGRILPAECLRRRLAMPFLLC
jgi:hypothetical protein